MVEFGVYIMKSSFVSMAGLLMVGTSVVAQTACRQTTGKVVEHRDTFTIVSITLPSQPSSLAAIAVVSDSYRPAGAYVFTLSKFLSSDRTASIEMLPAAIHLATEGHSSILLQRVLTSPNIRDTVGEMKQQALCAEQWLSTHAAIKPDDWTFVGPHEDVPSFAQLRQAGDATRMTFQWELPLAGYGDTENSENVLRRGILESIDALTHSHEQAVN